MLFHALLRHSLNLWINGHKSVIGLDHPVKKHLLILDGTLIILFIHLLNAHLVIQSALQKLLIQLGLLLHRVILCSIVCIVNLLLLLIHLLFNMDKLLILALNSVQVLKLALVGARFWLKVKIEGALAT